MEVSTVFYILWSVACFVAGVLSCWIVKKEKEKEKNADPEFQWAGSWCEKHCKIYEQVMKEHKDVGSAEKALEYACEGCALLRITGERK